MYTRCPACQTVFHLRASQLGAAHGQVRCGDCGEIFQSLSFLYDNADAAMADSSAAVARSQPDPEPQSQPESPPEPEPQSEPEPERSEQTSEEPVPIEAPPEPSLADVLAEPDQDLDVDETLIAFDAAQPGVEPEEASLDQQKPEAAIEVPDGVQAPASDEPPLEDVAAVESADKDQSPPRFDIPPEFILDRKQGNDWTGARVASWAAAVVLMLTLIGQGVYVSRGKLADDPDLLPWVARFCSVLDCELPFSRDIGGIQIVERQVREHPDSPGALLVYTTFVNTSSFVQPYPVLELRLADLSGGRVAGRRFLPSEYLQENANVKAGLLPYKPVTVELELVQPDIKVVSYQFDFL